MTKETKIGEEVEQDIMLVLDFVERWNKQDKGVAQAAQRLEDVHETLLFYRQQIAEKLEQALEGMKKERERFEIKIRKELLGAIASEETQEALGIVNEILSALSSKENK